MQQQNVKCKPIEKDHLVDCGTVEVNPKMESKQSEDKRFQCFVCARDDCVSRFLIHGLSGKRRNLSHLLQLYGGLYVKFGAICQRCLRHVLVLDKKVTQFREMCQKNKHLIGDQKSMGNKKNTIMIKMNLMEHCVI